METPSKNHEKIIATFFNDLSKIDVMSESDGIENDLLNEFINKYTSDTSPYLLTQRDIKILNFYFETLGYTNTDKILIIKALLQKEITETTIKTQ